MLRLLILKHLRNWSYQVLEREVRANLVNRDFTRVGSEKMPDAKTMGRWGIAPGPVVIQQIHERTAQIAQAQKVVQGRKMRVDTTVVERNIHYPTYSSLLAGSCGFATGSNPPATPWNRVIWIPPPEQVYRLFFTEVEMAKGERWKGIPTELSLERFREFVLPHLSANSRGPDTKLSPHALFTYISKQPYLGCQ